RLPEVEKQRIDTKVNEEAAKDKVVDKQPSKPAAEEDAYMPKGPAAEKPKFKVTRSPFAPRIEQPAKEPEIEPLSWGDEDEFEIETPAAKQAEPAKKAPVEEPAKTEPVKAEPAIKPAAKTRAAFEVKKTTPAPAKEEAKPAAKEEIKPVAKEAPKVEAKEAPKDDKPKITPLVSKPAPTSFPKAEQPKPAEATKAAAQPLPTPVAKKAAPTKLPTQTLTKTEEKPEEAAAQKSAPTRLPKPAAAPKPKAAPVAPARAARHEEEEEEENVSIMWVAVDAIAAVVSLVFAVLVFMNVGV
ncbi:MAG: hypothetical protein ACQKBV_13125, partial [Puniceicoccales bacterium]